MMKNLLKTVFILLLSANAIAATLTESFDTFSTGGYGNYTHNGWAIVDGLAETDAAHKYLGTKGVRLDNDPGAALISPSKLGGIGDISFWYRNWDSTPIDFYVYTSPDSTTWTVVDSVKGLLNTTFVNYVKTINDPSAKFFKIVSSGQRMLILDEFSITDATVACTGYYIDSVATEICAFDSVEFRGGFYKTDGIYKDTVNSTCDTIFILNLTTTIYTSYDVADTICSVGDSLLFNGVYVKTAGVYYDTTVRAGNCDSITKLTLALKYCPTPCGDLFISEYIEGSGNNKALEFYNPTNTTISLSQYKIVVFRTSNDTIQLNGSIAPGDVHVMSNPSAALAGITSNSDETALLYFNGDDRIELLKNGFVIDRFGNVGVVGNFARDETYQRKKAIENGSLTFSTADWNILIEDTDSLIGSHESNCMCTPTNDTLTEVICHGTNFMFDGQARTMTGFYRDSNINAGGCDSVIVLNLTVNDYIRDTLTEAICQGTSFVFDGQTITMTGLYSDTLTTLGGCDSISVLDLTVSDYIRDTLTEVICQGASFVFDGQTITIAGLYSDTLSTSGGCDSISVLDLTVTTIDNTVAVTGLTLTANDVDPNTTYVWVDCNNSYAAITPSETGQSFTAITTGNYAVILTNGSCTDTSACIQLNTTSIDGVNNEIGASIYPNPTTDIVNVKVSKLETYSLTVMDVSGKVVMNTTITNQLSHLDFNGYESGVYFITLYNKNQKSTFKLLVK